MNKFYRTTFFYCLAFLCLCVSMNSFAEGSKDLYPSGVTGHRACLMSTTFSNDTWPFPAFGTHYAYVRLGESISAASSAQGVGNGYIVLTAPDGTTYSTAAGTATEGRIADRNQELNGPFVGYTPFTKVAATASQEGIWKIEFYPAGSTSTNTNNPTIVADGAWTQDPGWNAIAAWDVSVSSAGTAATIIPGRVYTNVMNMYVTDGRYYGVLYVQTKDGYTYRVNNNGLGGIGFVFFVNNKGITNGAGDAATPTYKSFDGTNGVTIKDPRTPDGPQSITQKIFYARPDNNLPQSAPMPGSLTTWLKVPKIIPRVDNIVIKGVEGTVGQVSRKGAYIEFNASQAGAFRITLTGTNGFDERTITGSAAAGHNSVYWDGKDGNNDEPPLGTTAGIIAKIQLQGAEVHFPFYDVERNADGIIIQQLNDDGSVKSDLVYWDDSDLPTLSNQIASNPKANNNSGSGLSSTVNGHRWSGTGTSAAVGYGNARTMDTWTYILGDVATEETSVDIRQADLEMVQLAPSSPITQIVAGQTITYNMSIRNNGPHDVTGAAFKFDVPAGFTIENLSDVTATTSCGTVNNPSIDANGDYNARLNMPNGCVINFSITGKAGAALAGGSIEVIASIMRANDVTDPDATNPNTAVPPTDPHVECMNGGPAETCNNIKRHTAVSVIPGADIVTVKTTPATTYVPGSTVTYTITVTNNGPNDATNVNIQDNAPAGTTIGDWTAMSTQGVVTIPNPSGNGNVNETIALLPNGAQVTYVMELHIPSDFSANISNTATVTSSTNDPAPGCISCTTPPIGPSPSADIVTTKTTAATAYVPGSSLTYTIRVKNDGPSDAVNVNIKDDAPAGTTISFWEITAISGMPLPPVTDGSGNLDQTIAAFPNGAEVVYEVTLAIPASFSADIINTATVTSGTPDPQPACTACTTPPLSAAPSADIVTVKSTAATEYVPGSSVTYTILVKNDGPSDAVNVNIQDVAPAGTTISNWTVTAVSGMPMPAVTTGSGNLDQTIAAFPDAAEITYEITLDISSGRTGSLQNIATVTSGTPDPDGNCTGCTTPPISPAPGADIVTTKTTTATEYIPGSSVTYTISVGNDGPSDAANVRIQDIAPAGTTISNWRVTAVSGMPMPTATSGSGDLDQTIPAFPDGAEVVYEVTVTIPSNFTANLENTAAVTSSTPDPQPACTTCTTPPIAAAPSADIVTTKTTTATEYVPGSSVSYIIRVRNDGPSDAANVNIQDNAPAGTTISAWTGRVISGAITPFVTSGSGNLDQTIASFPDGAEVEYELTVAIPSSFTANITNTATVTSGTPDPQSGCTTCTTPPIGPAPSADIVTTKTTTATEYVPGSSVSYIIRVKNDGPSDASNVNIQDIAPAGTTISSWTGSVISGTITPFVTSGSGNLNQTIASFPNGAEVEYEVILDISSGFTANLQNTATVTSGTPDPQSGCTTCTTPPISPAPSADIVTTKTTAATEYTPGSSVTYTIRVRNDGPSDAANVNIQDNAPAGTTISNWTGSVISGTITPFVTSGSGNLNQTIASFPDGAEVEYELTVNIPSNFTANITNTATVTSSTPDPQSGCTTCTTPPIGPAPSADIVTTKTTAATAYVPGSSVTYIIRVKNDGPSDAANVNIQDNAPAGTTISAWTGRVISGTITPFVTSGNGNLDQTIASFPNGAEVEYELTVAIPSGFTANLENTATVTSSTPDPQPACITCTTPPISAAPSADIVTTKTTTATEYIPGRSVTYTIRVRNDGPSDASNVNIQDNAPAGTTISAWTGSVISGTITPFVTSGSGNLNQTIAAFPDGAEVAYEVTLDIPSGFTGNLQNTATVSSGTPDPQSGCTTCTTPPISANPSADIVTTKTTDATDYVPGSSVIYTINVRNDGPSDAANVNIQDNAPAGTSISHWEIKTISGMPMPVVNSGSGNLNQTIGNFPNGAEVAYEVTVNIPSGFTGNLQNTATVTSGTPDPQPACTTCTTPPISAAPSADIVTTKTTTATRYVPGGSVTYTITVRNDGPSDAANVNIQDNAPAGTTISSWTGSVVSGTVTPFVSSGSGNLNQTIASFPNGATVAYEVTVAIPSNFTGNLQNTATVVSGTNDPQPGCTTCTTTPISDAPSADIVTTKTTTATEYVPGRTVTYTITVRNDGPSDATNVNVRDIAPAGTVIGNWSASVANGTVSLPNESGSGNLNETIALFPNGAEVAYEVTVAVPASFRGNLQNTATVTSSTDDPVPACTACTTPPISAAPSADIVTTKTTAATTYVPGSSVTYTITVTNNGPSDAANVNIQDIAPAGTTISNWTARVSSGTVNLPHASGTGNLNETIAVFPDAAVVTYEVTVNIPSDYNNNLQNTAAVSSATPDPAPGCSACTTPAIGPSPSADIVTVKTTQNPAQVSFIPGESVTYTITVTNNGPSDAANVRIQDIAPAGTTISSWTASVTNGTLSLPNTSGTGNLDETIASFPDGAVVTFVVTVQTPADYTGTMTNTAIVSSGTPDPSTDCPACTSTPITAGLLNSAPIAADNILEGKTDAALTIPVLDNDQPGPGASPSPIDPSTLEIVEQPQHGTIRINEDGTIVYTPNRGYYGEETFTYRVQDAAGNWSNVAMVRINITPNDLQIPNVITPNADGNNDRFVIKGLEKYTQHEIIIFNRWNNMLFRSKNYQGDWDGKGLNAGTYFYTLKVQEANGQWHTHNGYIMLMR